MRIRGSHSNSATVLHVRDSGCNSYYYSDISLSVLAILQAEGFMPRPTPSNVPLVDEDFDEAASKAEILEIEVGRTLNPVQHLTRLRYVRLPKRS